MRIVIDSARYLVWMVGGLTFFVAHFAGAAQFEISDAVEFNKIIDTNTAVLTTNATVSTASILEGPTWIPGNPGHLIFSSMNWNYGDTNGNKLKQLVPPNTVSDYLVPPGYTVYNGSTLDLHERFISCQSGSAGLRVVMITNNNVISTLVATCNGLKFYSPNDVVAKSDGTIWFTDPGFNSGINYPTAGYANGHNVYRFDPADGNATCTTVIAFASNNARPNGLCFSPDESLLYLADWGNSRILVYSVSPSNTLSYVTVFATLPNGGNPDGIRCDADGRVYSSSGDGVYVFMPHPDGRLVGHIITAGVQNLCFGGADRRTLFIASQQRILSIPLKVTGAVWLRTLQIATMNDSSVQVTWPWPSTDFQLQISPTLDSGTWTPAPYSPSVSNGLNLIQFTPTNSSAFFRLCPPSP